MDKLNFRYRIASLIAEEFSGVISEHDREELDTWLKASSANQEEYKQIVDRLKTELPAKERVDLNREWSAFKKQVLPRRVNLTWWYSAAAVFICLVAVFLYLQAPKEKQLTIAGNKPKDIVKEHKAILVMADGRRMNISGDSVIADANGLQIVTSGNRLKYEQGENSKDGDTQYNTLIIPRGAEYELRMSDGTIAWLNSNSSLTYPVSFNGDLRNVKMDGEVCFDVARREYQPFIVTTGDVSVKVLGTLFNMEAYQGEPIITTLVRGKVEVSNGKTKRIIVPNQQAIIAPGRFDVKQVYADDFVEWTTGVFNFTNTPLNVIMDRLARWYDIEVIYATPSAKNAKFSLEIKRPDNIASVLSKIEKTGRVRFSIEGKTVTVTE